MSDISDTNTNSSGVLSQVAERVQTTSTSPDLRILREITKEEQSTILEKLKTFALLPAGKIPEKDSLYIEQQVSDLLGFKVCSELESFSLTHVVGSMKALPHLKRHHTDDTHQHQAIPEAGLSKYRSAFGWYTEHGELSPQAVLAERFYMSLPLHYLSDWGTNRQKISSWYDNRKMIVINPFEERSVVCSVGDIGPNNWYKHQFGGSPEVIRTAKIWSLRTMGKVLVFFVDDADNSVPLGPKNIATL